MMNLNASLEQFKGDSLDPNDRKPKLQDSQLNKTFVKYNQNSNNLTGKSNPVAGEADVNLSTSLSDQQFNFGELKKH